MKLREYFGLGQVFTYFFRKHDPSRPTNFNVKAMHWSNRISIIMFLVGLVVIITKLLTR